ncbi:MAG: lysophospholipid acyltransferase family protein [Chryseotalea sp.]
MAFAKDWKLQARHELVYRAVQFVTFISFIIPRSWWLAFCGFVGKLAYYVAAQTRTLMHRHIAMAYPDWSQAKVKKLAKTNFSYLAKNAGEILRATKVKTLSDLEAFLKVHDFHLFEAARDQGKGVIFLTCHIGAFDLQVTYMSLKGMRPLIIGTPLKNKKLNDMLWQHRNAHGAIAVERGKEMFRLLKELKSGGSLAILIDQDTKVKSRFVNFYGIPAATPVGAAVFAIKTGAVVVPIFIHLGKDGLQHIRFYPAIETIVTGDEETDMVVNTQRYSDFIEARVREYPEHWVWMHELWKTKPGEEVR